MAIQASAAEHIIRKKHNVWYRNFLKPFVRANRPLSYKESFKRRVAHTVGVPVDEIEGTHALFKPEFRQYSLLYGMIFTHNHFIDNLYRYGNSEGEPAVDLIRELFTMLPGGEIQTTHAGRKAGAHLTPGLIGILFEELEHLKSELAFYGIAEFQEKLSTKLATIFVEHEDYQHDIERLQQALHHAESELEALQQKEDEAAPVRQRIKELEGDVVKAARHQIKRLKKELKSAGSSREEEISKELERLSREIDQAEVELTTLRQAIVTSLDFKVARKNLRRAQDAVNLERENRLSLAGAIAKSFCAYELDFPSVRASLPKFSTVAVLQSFLWRKYDSISVFSEYFEAMNRLGALNATLEDALELIHAQSDDSTHASSGTDGSSSSKIGSNNSRRPSRAGVPHWKWSASDIEKATTITMGTADSIERPPIVQFSYVTWAGYSQFPDCGETALRNLFNQIVYNPKSQKFDHEVLLELKDRFYPEMSPRLIEFYKRNSDPQESVHNTNVAVAWIDVVSDLNNLRGWTKDNASETFIRYRRETEGQNIASPLRNALKVVNGLFGVRGMKGAHLLKQVVERIQELRGWQLEIDVQGVKSDGFGVLGVVTDKVRYELQSYKPVHFGFVQTDTIEQTEPLSAGRQEYRAFRKLMIHSDMPSHAPTGSVEYFEHLALASLFVPYHLRRKTEGRFFHNLPAEHVLLFADLNSESCKQEALEWAKRRQTSLAAHDRLHAWVKSIETYVEPEFAPTKKEKQHPVVQEVQR